jgi:sugar O-acyltransferase (sialic acid O-acetyltransferase NeuD family)
MTEGKRQVFILGAGGQAAEVFEIYAALGREKDVIGFLEENCQREGIRLNEKIIWDVSYLEGLPKGKNYMLIAAIGSTKRKRIIEKLERECFEFDTVVHPNAIVSKRAKIGEGSIITAGTIITCQIEIGRHVLLNMGTHVAHDAKIGDYTTLSPGTEVMGRVSIGRQVFVGANATIIEKVKVADGAIIAAGAVVTQDVPENALAAGVPATVKKIYHSIEEKPW